MLFQVAERDPDTRARTGMLELPHGRVATPVFVPVGTNATVKAVASEDLEALGLDLILSNTYHLYLRPGAEVIAGSGGLHRFMGWKGNILTDSGGFQVFSLAPFRRIEEGGVYFKSHLDGSAHRFTPQEVVRLQRIFGSDILMPLDVCTPPAPQVSRQEAIRALELTSLWAAQSLAHWKGERKEGEGWLFGIIQGNFFQDLRRRSAEELLALEFPGYAIGGLSVGEPFETFKQYLTFTVSLLPEQLPRYLMGIGTPEYILEAVENGIDLFDCVFPTRSARNALVLTHRGPLSLRKEENRLDSRPIDPECSCSACRRYSRSYLRHLFKAKEILAPILATHHNLSFITGLMVSIRRSIREGRFRAFKRDFLARYHQNREEEEPS